MSTKYFPKPLFAGKKWITFLSIVVLSWFLFSCKKFVQVDPPANELVSSNVYDNDASASSVLIALYTKMMGQSNFPNKLDQYSAIQADEMRNYSSNLTLSQFYTNALVNTNVPFWSELYNDIFISNSVLDGLDRSTSITKSVRDQLIGEAEFTRAFFYFYLVNLWGDVPLVTSASNYQAIASMARTSKDQVYQQIVTDLIDAQSKLSSDFVGRDAVTPTTERTRPTKWAATALLARVYLYTREWAKAEAQADSIIESRRFTLLQDLKQVFLANSQEAIWQLQPVAPTYNTYQAYNLILTAAPGTTLMNYTLSPILLKSFESGDQRMNNWVGTFPDGDSTYYYAYKYKVNVKAPSVSEYLMVLRLGEQYLIRAEARAQLNKLDMAAADLNAIRVRAGLPDVLTETSTSQTGLLAAILHERQVELFTEWGHRWLDLKRTGNVDAVMSVVTPEKGGIWSNNWQWYPLPLLELQSDKNLTQNVGY